MDQSNTIRIPIRGKHGEGKFALVDTGPLGEQLASYKWYLNTANGYPCRNSYKDGRHLTFYMHREVVKAPKGMVIDHINRSPLDNRTSNLRIVTQRQNMANSPMRPVTNPAVASKYRGVNRCASKGRVGNRWTASACSQYIGTFATEEEAAKAYDRVAYSILGEFASLNFPLGH